MFRICSEFSVIFRICSEFLAIFRIFSEFLVIFRHFSVYLAQKLVYSESLDFVVDASYQVSVHWLRVFRGED
jgi:hypothetical protein